MNAPSSPLLASDVANSVVRHFLLHDLLSMVEVPLPNGRRADIMAISAKGEITIVEIKVSRADLLGDTKWREYRDYCDRYYWAVPHGFDLTLMEKPQLEPECTGLIVADRYESVILREPETAPIAAARRKVEILRFARRATRRLIVSSDAEEAEEI